MGEVYSAIKILGGPDLGPRRILKLIRPDSFEWNADEASDMLVEEGSVTASLDHRNIVKVYDVATYRGVTYIEMETLVGCNFRAAIKALRQSGKTLRPDLVAALFAQACDGLHAAHQQTDFHGEPLNIIHRDISPSNLFCTSKGVVKVIDFGIAKFRGRAIHTETGFVRGKLEYFSPEQARRESYDHRTDIWSLGVVAHEFLSLNGPLFYRGNSRDAKQLALQAVAEGTIPELATECPDAPPKLRAIIMRALSRDPEQRFQTAREFGQGFREVVREAGGYYNNLSRIASGLADCGVDLTGPHPSPITSFPFELNSDENSRELPTIDLPPEEKPIRLPNGRVIEVECKVTNISHLQSRSVQIFEDFAHLLPVELGVSANQTGSLVLRLGDPFVQFTNRPPNIYLDPNGYQGKSKFLSIPPDTAEAQCSIGHRHVKLVQVGYASVSTQVGDRLTLQLPRLGLRLRATGRYSRIVALDFEDSLEGLQSLQILLVR